MSATGQFARKSLSASKSIQRRRRQLRVESLERRELLATLTWDGGAGTPNWGDATNWSSDQVPGGADVAVFNDQGPTGAVTVDLGGARTSQIQFTNDATRSYTLSNGTILTTSITQTGAGANTINSQIIAGAVTTVGISGGTLTLGNTANALDASDSINVSNNANLVIISDGGSNSGVGSAALNLNNGNASIGGTIANSLDARLFNNQTGTALINGDNFPIQNNAPTITKPLNQALNFTDDNAFTSFFGSGLPGGNNFIATFSGIFRAPVSGTYTFHILNHDDAGVVWIDGNNNGILDAAASDRLINATGCCAPGPQTNVTLNAGQEYRIAFAVEETGGGSNLQLQYALPGGGLDFVNPANGAQANQWFGQVPTAVINSNVSVTGNSRITAPPVSVTFGNLTVASGANLTTAGGNTIFGTTALGGNATFTTSGGALLLNGIVSGNAAITKQGPGRLELGNAGNSYTGTTTVGAGTLQVNSNGALGTTAAGTVVNAGATLALRASYSNAEALTLNGTLDSNGDFTWTAPFNTGAGARITSSAGTLTLPGAVRIAGGLVVDGAGTVNISGQVGVATNAQGFIPGLIAGALAGDPNLTSANPGNTGVLLRPEGGYTNVSPPWAGNTTLVYSGQFRDADGLFAFAEHIDDRVFVYIDGVLILQNETWNQQSSSAGTANGVASKLDFGMGPNGDGWHNIEIRMSNGGGGAGATGPGNGGNGWTTTFGFGVNRTPPAGFNSADASQYVELFDPGDGSILRVDPATLARSTMITKNGAGTLILSNANNTYPGITQVNAGTLRATTSGALGTSGAGTNVASGATLELNGAFSSAEPLSLVGAGMNNAGALSGIGNATVTGPITLNSDTTISNNTANTTLTLTGPITRPVSSNLTLGGIGNVAVQTDLAAGLAAVGPMTGRLFNGSTGLGINNETGINSVAFTGSPTTSRTLTGGLNFPQDSDGAFTAFFGGGVPGGTNFTAAFVGDLTVTAAGTFYFAISQNDDLATVWVDLDRNGTFQAAEMIQAPGCCNNVAVPAARTLAAGTYKIAYAVEDGGGGSGLVGRISVNPAVAPTSATAMALIVAGAADNLIKNGTGTATLAGNNSFGGAVTVNAGTLVAGTNSALGTGGTGTTVNAGGTLGLQGGITLTEAITANGVGATGQAGAIANISGNNAITSAITAAQINQGALRIGSTAGTLTVGSIDTQASRLSVAGAGNVVISGNVTGAGGPIQINAIQETIFNGVPFNAQDNIEGYRNAAVGPADARGFLTSHLTYPNDAAVTARAQALGAVGFNDGDFSMLWVTTFTPNADGAWGFRFSGSDDNTSMWIDSNQNGTFEAGERFQNSGCCPASGDRFTPGLTTGQRYLLGIVLSDTGGGGNLTNLEFNSPTGGGAWQPLNPSQFPGQFTSTIQSDNQLVKSGAGTLTVNGTMSLAGGTTVSGGTVNGTGTLLGPTTVGAGGFISGGPTGAIGTLVVGIPAVNGTPVTANQSSAGAFPVSSTDLLNGLTGVVTGTALGGQEGTSSNAAVLTNGTFGPAGLPDGTALAETVSIGNNTTVTYTLNTTTNPRGYNISAVDVYSGWRDAGRDNLTYTVRYATVANPGVFTDLAPGVNFAPAGNTPASGKSSISANAGVLASGVSQIQFVFGTQENGFVGYRELDVIGAPTPVAASVTIGAGGTFRPEIGVTADQLTVNGTVTISSTAVLDPLFIGTPPAVGTVLTLINNDGADPISGTFSGIANGATVTIGGRSLTVSYTGGTGNDLTVTVNATAPTITFVGTASGFENTSELPTSATRIPLGIQFSSLDVGTTTSVTISNIPAGAQLVNQSGVAYAPIGTPSVTLSGAQLTPLANGTLNVFLTKIDNRPQGSPSGTFTLNIQGSSTPATGTPGVTNTTRDVTVTNEAPSALITGPEKVVRGIPTTYVFEGLDALGDLATMSYAINWGDGSSLSPRTPAAGEVSLSLEHTFSREGTFTITLTVTDPDGATGTAELEVTVSTVFVDDNGNLIIGGTGSADRIVLSGGAGGVVATINNKRYPGLTPDADLGGRVIIYGGGGNDTITVSSSMPYAIKAFGGAGNDYIAGSREADFLHGEDGNDRLLGGNGDDTIFGGNGADNIAGGAGDDMLFGDSFLDADGIQTEGTGADTMSGDVGDDTLDGGAGRDRLNGGNGNDELYGRSGADRMSGDNGNDFLFGEEDADLLYGQAGDDVLIGGGSADTLYGGNGSDLMLGDGMSEATALLLYIDWLDNGIGSVEDDPLSGYASQVDADGSPDMMYGQTSNDWFLAFLIDKVRDGRSGDVIDRDP